MARRRMFSPDVICTDRFNEMPVSAQNLYVQLGMNIDDDGFVSPRRIMKTVNANEDDLRILVVKGFLIAFDSGVVCLAHHRVNNLLRKDWYRPTQYQIEAKQLIIEDKSGLIRLKDNVNSSLTSFVTESLPSRYQVGTINKELINKETNKEGAEEPIKMEDEEGSESELKYEPIKQEPKTAKQQIDELITSLKHG